MLKSYLTKLHQIYAHGDAREESFYSALETLIDDYAATMSHTHIHVTTLPKKTDAGNPDFRIWDGKQHIIGYIEAKAPTIERLDSIEHSEQLSRYRKTFPNLILTNFLEFRLYRDGEPIRSAKIGRPFVLHKLGGIPPVEQEGEFLALFEQFFAFVLPAVHNAKSLATELAKRTRFLRDEIIASELQGESKQQSDLAGFYDAFKTYLIGNLSEQDFADLYSQTIAYGLFAARTRAESGFNRKLAYDYIPRTIGILRDLFRFVSFGDLPKQMEWMLDDISDLLAIADVKQLLHQYFYEGKGADPIIHFYETFLAAYDPETRERRGVYYTPDPVVSYIVRSLHDILKHTFQRPYGLADDAVTVLDPAAGTLMFMAEAAKTAVQEYGNHWGSGAVSEFIRQHILRHFYAFELMMAPYAVGHLKMAFLLEELGCALGESDRFQLYLTNTLEMEELQQITLPGMKSLSEESHVAHEIKTRQNILVILGNPPYSGQSANTGTWITNSIKQGETLIEGVKDDGYYAVDGKPLNEKNPKWLLDDYVKFLRFAQCKIEQTGHGVVGMITNHSYLENPTFRGMRRSLMRSFDEIYVFDLHGNSLKKETCPDGSNDENVFDIRQGTAIIFLIKTPKSEASQECSVYHAELWGLRDTVKYPELLEKSIATTQWRQIFPQTDMYLFAPRDDRLQAAYQKNPRLSEIFQQSSVGVATARDNLALQWSPEEVWTTVLNFSKMDPELARVAYNLGEDARDWKVKLAQQDLLDSGLNKEQIIPLFYRPFDMRFTYYTGKSRGFHCMPRGDIMRHVIPLFYRPFDMRFTYYTGKSRGFHCRPREEVMRHIINESNLCLIFTRSTTANKPFTHVFCTEHGIIARFFPDASCVPYFAPLYVYPEKDLFNNGEQEKHRVSNLNPHIVKKLSETYQRAIDDEQIFFYIYAILHSEEFRVKYAKLLQSDYPRILFTHEVELFDLMAGFGKRLVELHLLASDELDPPLTKFEGAGDNRVEEVKYDPKKQLININAFQYFAPVAQDAWEFEIAGYQVCQKWLKDRKNRPLTFDDIKTYCHIVTALNQTNDIQKKIDEHFAAIEERVIEFA